MGLALDDSHTICHSNFRNKAIGGDKSAESDDYPLKYISEVRSSYQGASPTKYSLFYSTYVGAYLINRMQSTDSVPFALFKSHTREQLISNHERLNILGEIMEPN